MTHKYHVMAVPPNKGVEKSACCCQQLSLYHATKFGGRPLLKCMQ